MRIGVSFSQECRNVHDPRMRYVVYVYANGVYWRKRSTDIRKISEFLRKREWKDAKPSGTSTGKLHGLRRYELDDTEIPHFKAHYKDFPYWVGKL